MSVAEVSAATPASLATPTFGTSLSRLAAPAMSIAILAAAMFELQAMDWHAVLAMVPANPLFWLVFVLFYSTPIVAEWAIYRRIWGIPPAAITTMARKTVSNDLLFGYVGETYLYGWARRAGKAPGAAFGAVKDVALLSAAVGNSATILVALFTAPLLGRLHIAMPTWGIALAIAAVAAPPMVAIFGRKSVFHLPGAILRQITTIHILRSTSGIVLTAVMWHLALPEIALSWWVAFSALKLVLSRLPFVSNKDLVFAGATALLFGHHGTVATLMAMMASLSVAAHIVTGLAASTSGLVESVAGRLRHVGASSDTQVA
jgi:hypothetical protein